MTKQLTRLGIVIAFLATTQFSFGQNYSEQAKTYFSKKLDSKVFLELCIKSLPTMDDCKLIYKGQNAYTYFGFIADMKSKFQEELKKPTETFVDLKVESFTTEDIHAGKGNYAGGMKNLADKLQPAVTFYKIDLLREKGAEFGVAYKYWANISGKWVFFPKPWTAFEK
jgi:hypothetical protein